MCNSRTHCNKSEKGEKIKQIITLSGKLAILLSAQIANDNVSFVSDL